MGDGTEQTSTCRPKSRALQPQPTRRAMRAPLGLNRLLLLLVVVFQQLDVATAEQAPSEESLSSSSSSPPRVIVSLQVPLPFVPDRKQECETWASQGECDANPGFMQEECASSCGIAREATVPLLEGEDAAMGAVRFAEEYSLGDDDAAAENIALLLETAHALQAKQQADVPTYEFPKDITHCGKRPCSAGKLWKRAEEMRKADMHDAAGADYIRALMKTGIEVDFVERCHLSLRWALGSIRRQRERERREAIEEEKLEQRRQEELAAMEEARLRREEYESDFVKFGVKVQESLNSDEGSSQPASASIEADGTVEEEETSLEVLQLIRQVKQTYVQEGTLGNHSEVIQLLKRIPPGDKAIDVLLIEARCHELMGNHKSALSAAGKLVQKAANHDPWINDSPRMMAAMLGANAAMAMGLSTNALSFYQTVLKFDPEQERARKQYRGLKKVVKLLDKAEEQIQKGYNKAASVHVDDCLTAMRGLDVDSPLFRSKIQLKQCTILSGMGKHEEALQNCDSAVDLRLSSDHVSADSRREALLVRAEALLLDMDYDDAVSDFRAAFDLVPEDDDEQKRELQHKLQQTMHQQEMWNGGKKDYRFNENTGYPDGMPPQRDHAKILQLPIDLDNRDKSVKCAWLKKQFKTLVRKYHPDKYKGNKRRAARKFDEVKMAKDTISKEWNC